MTPGERAALLHDLAHVLLPRLTDAQLRERHRQIAAQVSRASVRTPEPDGEAGMPPRRSRIAQEAR